MDFFRRQQRKALAQVESHLMAENAERPGPGSIGLRRAMVQNGSQQLEILAHGLTCTARWHGWQGVESWVQLRLLRVLPWALELGCQAGSLTRQSSGRVPVCVVRFGA